ncbi:MAG: DUF1648 domain-containing protein [Verrucomicrobia bacterium]|nr:DUF1648 domain-containing protein [Verrucomicrobiota bacterium]
MRSARLPLIIFVLLYSAFVIFVLVTVGQLPDRVASHFDASGAANGWMSRDSHVRYMVTFGSFFPLAVPVVCYCVRFLPVGLVNIPRREYWLAPERKSETINYLFRHAVWFGCLSVCFVAGSHWLVVDANLHSPPQLSTRLLVAVAGGFIAGLAWWIVVLLRRFMRVPQ